MTDGIDPSLCSSVSLNFLIKHSNHSISVSFTHSLTHQRSAASRQHAHPTEHRRQANEHDDAHHQHHDAVRRRVEVRQLGCDFRLASGRLVPDPISHPPVAAVVPRTHHAPRDDQGERLGVGHCPTHQDGENRRGGVSKHDLLDVVDRARPGGDDRSAAVDDGEGE